MERDVFKAVSVYLTYNFNSHAHVERDERYYTAISVGCNFNSHAHVERDELSFLRDVLLYISTHTLTWSVTGAKLDDNAIIGISTHTLTWSVTAEYRKRLAEMGHFNSHAHVERDVQRHRSC